MKTSIFALLLLIVASLEIFGQTPDPRIGIVNSDDTGPCLAIQNANLKAGQKIVVVLPDEPQTTFTTFVEEKVENSCSSQIDIFEKSSFYRLKEFEYEDVFFGFGLVGIDVKSVKGVITANINGNLKPDYFRSCQGQESFLFTIWDGKPLIGKRIFEAGYYVPYGTEPTCKRKDYQTPK